MPRALVTAIGFRGVIQRPGDIIEISDAEAAAGSPWWQPIPDPEPVAEQAADPAPATVVEE